MTLSGGLHEAFIALGSNLGRREHNLTAALSALQSTRDIEVARVSSVFETEPEGGPTNQAKYLNAVARIETNLSPERVLAVCHRIEDSLGRKRTIRWGPRTIDLDVLLYDDELHATAELTLPHPMMHERRFVMEPMAEIAPDRMHPTLQRTMREITDALLAGESLPSGDW